MATPRPYRSFKDLISHIPKQDKNLHRALSRVDEALITLHQDIPQQAASIAIEEISSLYRTTRILWNYNPVYDLIGGAVSAALWMDPGGKAGDPTLSFGGEIYIPDGKQHNLIRMTGTMSPDTHAAITEFAGIRFEFKNRSSDLNGAMRGIIGQVVLTSGGHGRAGYFRGGAETGATGYFTSNLFAVSAASAQPAGNAIGLMVYSDGAPNRGFGIQLGNDAAKGYYSGIVFGDDFEALANAIRLRQATLHGRIQWGAAGPYIESPNTDTLSLEGNCALGQHYLILDEMAAPAAPNVNKVRIFAQDNGAGKTQVMAIFNTGAAVQVAIQP